MSDPISTPKLVVDLIREALRAELDHEAKSAISAQDHQIERLRLQLEEAKLDLATLREAMHKRLEFIEMWLHRHKGQVGHPVGLLPDLMPQQFRGSALPFGPAPHKPQGAPTTFERERLTDDILRTPEDFYFGAAPLKREGMVTDYDTGVLSPPTIKRIRRKARAKAKRRARKR